jgi:hypothetical protein
MDVLDFYLVTRYVQCVSINDNEKNGEYGIQESLLERLAECLVLVAWVEASLSTSSTVSFPLLLTRDLSLSMSSSSQSS